MTIKRVFFSRRRAPPRRCVIRKCVTRARASYHSICPYVLVMGIALLPIFPPRRARSPDGLCAAILAFCSLHTTHRPVQRTELAIHLFWHFIVRHGGKPNTCVFLSQLASCPPQYL